MYSAEVDEMGVVAQYQRQDYRCGLFPPPSSRTLIRPTPFGGVGAGGDKPMDSPAGEDVDEGKNG